MAKPTGQKKDQCKEGISCGVACISRKKTCRKNLSSQQAKMLAGRMGGLLKSAGLSKAGGGGGAPEQKTQAKTSGGKIGSKNTPEQNASLKELEGAWRGNDFETGGLVGKDGRMVWRRKGDKDSVSVEGLEKVPYDKRRESVMTHNHPNHKIDGDEYNGGSFSPEDILTANAYSLKGIRATDRDYTYELNIPEENSMPSRAGQELVQKAWKQIREEEKMAARERSAKFADEFEESDEFWDDPEESYAIIERRSWQEAVDAIHYTNERMAEEFGWEYTRTKNDEV